MPEREIGFIKKRGKRGLKGFFPFRECFRVV